MSMDEFTIVATLDGDEVRQRFCCPEVVSGSDLDQEFRATMDAIAVILEVASDLDDPRREHFSKGAIQLVTPGGVVIHEMEAK